MCVFCHICHTDEIEAGWNIVCIFCRDYANLLHNFSEYILFGK